MANVLVTGAAGFIGHHLTRRLLERGDRVLGLDSLDPYYDPALKRARLADLGLADAARPGAVQLSPRFDGLAFLEADLADPGALAAATAERPIDAIVHLAAQAGVRYSLENPAAYIASNLTAFGHVLELARARQVAHFVYASSSSVYGDSKTVPYTPDDRADAPISLYAATKRANELMAHSYSHLFRLPCTGLRFFTVYGPWGRPDMATFKFTRRILEGRPIDLFNHGEMQRDFTYVGDIVEGLMRVLDAPMVDTPDAQVAPARVYNIGRGTPIQLKDFVRSLERAIGRPAIIDPKPMQPGDMACTWADTSGLERDFGYRPQTSLDEGVDAFVAWYRDFYGV